jgi:hypothetical protein
VKLPWDLVAVWRLAMEPGSVFARVFVSVFPMGFPTVLVMTSVMGLVLGFSSGQHTKREKQSLTWPLSVVHDAVIFSSSLDLLLDDFFLL